VNVSRHANFALSNGPRVAAMHAYDATDTLQVLKHLLTIQIFRRSLHDNAKKLPEEVGSAADNQDGKGEGAERVQDGETRVDPQEATCDDHKAILNSISNQVEPGHFAGHATVDVAMAVNITSLAQPESKAAVNDERNRGGETYDLSSPATEHVGREQTVCSCDEEVARNDVLTDQGDENTDNF